MTWIDIWKLQAEHDDFFLKDEEMHREESQYHERYCDLLELTLDEYDEEEIEELYMNGWDDRRDGAPERVLTPIKRGRPLTAEEKEEANKCWEKSLELQKKRRDLMLIEFQRWKAINNYEKFKRYFVECD